MNKVSLTILFFLSVWIVSCSTAPKKVSKKAVPVGSSIQKTSVPSGPTIGTHAKLFISVYREPDLTTEVTVASGGTIDYAYLGIISIKGLTTKGIAEKITGLLKKDYIVYPQVTVKVREYGRVYVFGNVNRPGIVRMKTEITPVEAIMEAGGFSYEAQREWLKVIRTVDGKKREIEIILNQSRAKHSVQTMILQPEDTLIVF